MSTATDPATQQTLAASQLLGFGLRPKLRPASDSTYQDLVERYQGSGAFRASVEAIAQGMGLAVLEVTAVSGVVLIPVEGSVYLRSLSAIPEMGTFERRVVFGIALLGVTAYAFPSKDALARDHVGVVVPVDVDAFLSQEIGALSDGEGDADTSDQHLLDAWRLWTRLPQTKGTHNRLNSRLGAIRKVIAELEAQGMLRPDGTDRWKTTERFRISVRDGAALAAFKQLQQAVKAEGE